MFNQIFKCWSHFIQWSMLWQCKITDTQLLRSQHFQFYFPFTLLVVHSSPKQTIDLLNVFAHSFFINENVPINQSWNQVNHWIFQNGSNASDRKRKNAQCQDAELHRYFRCTRLDYLLFIFHASLKILFAERMRKNSTYCRFSNRFCENPRWFCYLEWGWGERYKSRKNLFKYVRAIGMWKIKLKTNPDENKVKQLNCTPADSECDTKRKQKLFFFLQFTRVERTHSFNTARTTDRKSYTVRNCFIQNRS